MLHFLDHIRLAAPGILAAMAFVTPAQALLIIPTFDSTLTSNANAAAYEAAINTAIGTIDGLYSSPGTVQVLFAYNSGVLGQSNTTDYKLSYTEYTNLLKADSAANPGNTVLSTAVAHLSSGNTANSVDATSALLRVALGLSAAVGCLNASGVCGTGGTYDSIVSIGNVGLSSNGPGLNTQAVSVLEHELDEVLGGGGTGTTLGDSVTSTIGPTDLYRYQSSGSTCANVDSTPSYTTSSSEVACYSIDGGQTSLVQMNEAGGGSDYGDFANVGPAEIQDAFYPGATPLYTDLSPEFTMMESIGYDTPEPATFVMFTGAIAGLGWLRRRRARGTGGLAGQVPWLTSMIPGP
jgi:hypothetical protein